MTTFFLGIVSVSLTMSIVILVLLGLGKLFGARFTAKCRYLIWTIVMLRLALLPFAGDGWLYTIVLPTADEEVVEEAVVPPSVPETMPTVMEQTPLPETPVVSVPEGNYIPVLPSMTVSPEIPVIEMPSAETVATEPVQMGELPPAEEPKPFPLREVLAVAGLVYFAGAAGYAVLRLTAHYAMLSPLQRGKKHPDASLRALYAETAASMGVKRAPRLYVSDGADCPMLFGYLHPTVLLPELCEADAKTRGMLAHELTHHRRGDVWMKLVCLVGESLHWFNPLVHLAARRWEQETELACDERVLAGLDEQARVDYGYAMLEMVRESRRGRMSLTTHYSPKKSAVRERFENILDMRHKRRGILVIVLAVLLTAAAGFAVSCKLGDGANDMDGLDDAADPAVTTDAETDAVETTPPEQIEQISENGLAYSLSLALIEREDLYRRLAEQNEALAALDAEMLAVQDEIALAFEKKNEKYTLGVEELAIVEAQIAELQARHAALRDQVQQENAKIQTLNEQIENKTTLLIELCYQLMASGSKRLSLRDGRYYFLPERYTDEVTAVYDEIWPDAIATFYQTAAYDAELGDGGRLFTIKRHTPEQLKPSDAVDLSHPGLSYFARDRYYWYGVMLPTDVQYDLTSDEKTAAYHALFEEKEGILVDFIRLNNLTPVDAETVDRYAALYASDAKTAYASMTTEQDWYDIIAVPAVQEDVCRVVNALLDCYATGGDVAEFLSYPGRNYSFPENVLVPRAITGEEVVSYFKLDGVNPVVSLPLGDGWQMEILLTTFDWNRQWYDYADYDGRDLTIADVHIHNDGEKDAADATLNTADMAEQLITLQNLADGYSFARHILPVEGEHPYQISMPYDDRYILFVSAGRRDAEEGWLYVNVRLAILDTETMTMVYDALLAEEADFDHMPQYIRYMADGCLLYALDRDQETGEYTAQNAFTIRKTDSGFMVARVENPPPFPYHRSLCMTPDGKTTAYYVCEDGNGGGGIEVRTEDGTATRILRAVMLEEAGGIQGVRGYTPIGFLDNTRLVYSIGGWEWLFGYGIYDIATGENILFENGERVEGASDGVLYISTGTKYDYPDLCLWRVTPEGEKTLIAAREEATATSAGVPMLSDSFHVFQDGVWFVYKTGVMSGYNHKALGDTSRLEVDVYSADFTTRIATFTVPYNQLSTENIDANTLKGTNLQVVVPVQVVTMESIAYALTVPGRLSALGTELVQLDFIADGYGVQQNLLPIAGEGRVQHTLPFDRQYMLYLYANHEETGGYSNLRLLIVDGETMTAVSETLLADRAEHLPTSIRYTDDGCELFGAVRDPESDSDIIHLAFTVHNNGDSFTVTRVDSVPVYPRHESLIFSPDGKTRAYHVDEGEGTIYVEIRTEDGVVVRPLVNQNHRVGDDIDHTRAYSPVAFLDDTHLVYGIGEWEYCIGYGIYDLTTGERVEFENREHVIGVREGMLYAVPGYPYPENAYCIWRITPVGEKTLLAAENEETAAGRVPVLQEGSFYFRDGVWVFYDTGPNGAVASRLGTDMTVEVYNADLTETIARFTIPYGSSREAVSFDGTTVTVTLPVQVVEEKAEEDVGYDYAAVYADITQSTRTLDAIADSEASVQNKQAVVEIERMTAYYRALTEQEMRCREAIDALTDTMNTIASGDVAAYVDPVRIYEEASAACDAWETELTKCTGTLVALGETYTHWRDLGYTLEGALYDYADTAEKIDAYLRGDYTMHALLGDKTVAAEAAVALEDLLDHLARGDSLNRFYPLITSGVHAYPYGVTIPTTVAVEDIAAYYEEWALTDSHRFVIPISEASSVVADFIYTEYEGKRQFVFLDVCLRAHDVAPDAKAFADTLARSNGKTVTAYATVDFDNPTVFAAFRDAEHDAHLSFTYDGERVFRSTVEIPADYAYDCANVVSISGSDGRMDVVVELEADGVYTYLDYTYRLSQFEGHLHAEDCTGLYEAFNPASYIRFPCTNYPNMTDDITDTAALGVDAGDEAYRTARDYLLAVNAPYLAWYDGDAVQMQVGGAAGLRLIARMLAGGESGIVEGRDDLRDLYQQIIRLTLDDRGKYGIYACASALLCADGERLAAMLGMDDYAATDFSSLTVDTWAWSVSPIANRTDAVDFTVTIAESGMDALPVGTHTLRIQSGYRQVSLYRTDRAPIVLPESDAVTQLRTWLRDTGNILPEDGTDLTRAESGFWEMSYDWLATETADDGTLTLDVCFYADVGKFYPAQTVRYTFAPTDGAVSDRFVRANVVQTWEKTPYLAWDSAPVVIIPGENEQD